LDDINDPSISKEEQMARRTEWYASMGISFGVISVPLTQDTIPPCRVDDCCQHPPAVP
jgi:hypothetical protein